MPNQSRFFPPNVMKNQNAWVLDNFLLVVQGSLCQNFEVKVAKISTEINMIISHLRVIRYTNAFRVLVPFNQIHKCSEFDL